MSEKDDDTATLLVAKDAWLEGKPIGPVLAGNGIPDGQGSGEAAKECGISRHEEIEWAWVFETAPSKTTSKRWGK